MQHAAHRSWPSSPPNHLSVIDSLHRGAGRSPRRITYVGKAEYMDDWKTRYIFPALGMIPIDRGGGSAADRALSSAARLLEHGELFGIYPEGTRSRDGKLHKGHTGVARLALRTSSSASSRSASSAPTRVQPADSRCPQAFRDVRRPLRAPRSTVERYRGPRRRPA
ncbi:MAG: lysophospholipid acyltransferase family protein [Acidimicrobiia bacterium]|nr:lysophospholipid acyltransferase family protein [Acidimicrobiia bacterium]